MHWKNVTQGRIGSMNKWVILIEETQGDDTESYVDDYIFKSFNEAYEYLIAVGYEQIKWDDKMFERTEWHDGFRIYNFAEICEVTPYKKGE
jgi:hypothetical protein